MSANDEEINRREVAWRLFASEFRDADYSYAESDEERAPNYVVTPTGARVNRLFVVGVLTEVEYVSEDYLRARIVDPTGAFVVYAGQYQPEALTFLESAETPTFVAVTGKARTFQPDDSDIVYTSIRPEAISEVDATTRDNWVVTTTEQTIERVATMADALDLVERGDDLRAVLEARNVPPSLAAGITLAIDHYDTTEHYLAATRDLALDAARVVSGDRDEVRQHMVDPSDTTDEPVAVGLDDFTLATGDAQPVSSTPDTDDTDADETTSAEADADSESTEGLDATADAQASAATDSPAATDDDSEADAAPGSDSGAESDSGVEPDAQTESEPEPAAEPDAVSESEPETATVGADGSTSTESDSTSSESEEADTSEAETADSEPEVDTDEMYELSEEERREVEENYDVGFTTADEVEGEAGIEPEAPQPDAASDAESDLDTDTGTDETDEESVEDLSFDASESDTADLESEVASDDESAGELEVSSDAASDTEDADDTEDESATEEAGSDDDAAEAADVDPDGDLEDVVVETMQDLGDGDGAAHDAIVEAVVDSHGVDAEAVEEAIQDALMSGRCYESGENEFTAI